MTSNFVPWHILVIGNGDYDEDVGPLPGAITDAQRFAAEVPKKLGDEAPRLLVDGSEQEHYDQIDEWLKAPGNKKMLFLTGHGMRSHGIFYIQTISNKNIPVQEYIRSQVENLGHPVLVACFFGTCQALVSSVGLPSLGPRHQFSGQNHILVFSFNSEPGKCVLDGQNVYANVLIDMLSCGTFNSLQEVLEVLPEAVSNESRRMERPWTEGNLGTSPASLMETSDSLSEMSSASDFNTASPKQPELASTGSFLMVLKEAEELMNGWMEKLSKLDSGYELGSTIQCSVGLSQAMRELRKLLPSGTTFSQIQPLLPRRLDLLRKYVQGLGLGNARFPWDEWMSLSSKISTLYGDECAAAACYNLMYYASTLYFCQLRRMVVEGIGLDHEALLEIEQCLCAAAKGLVQQSRNLHSIPKAEVFEALHCWAVAQRWLGRHAECQKTLCDWFAPLLARATEEIQGVWSGRRLAAQKYQLLQQISLEIDLPTCYHDVAPFLYQATRCCDKLSGCVHMDVTLHMELNELLTWQARGWQLCATLPCIDKSRLIHAFAKTDFCHAFMCCWPKCTGGTHVLWRRQLCEHICQMSVPIESGTELALRKYVQEVGQVMLVLQRWSWNCKREAEILSSPEMCLASKKESSYTSGRLSLKQIVETQADEQSVLLSPLFWVVFVAALWLWAPTMIPRQVSTCTKKLIRHIPKKESEVDTRLWIHSNQEIGWRWMKYMVTATAFGQAFCCHRTEAAAVRCGRTTSAATRGLAKTQGLGVCHKRHELYLSPSSSDIEAGMVLPKVRRCSLHT